jgi:hypothetical protein
MNKQRGLALSGLLFWGVIIGLGSLLVIKVMPELIDYYKINKSVKSTAASASGLTVGEIRTAYSKYAEIEHIQTITPADLDISKEGASVIIGFSYEKRIPLFANVSLLIDFQGSSSGRE